MTRRAFLHNAAFGVGAFVMPRWIPLRAESSGAKPLKIAVITDLHHGLAPDAMIRLHAFVDAVKKRKGIDFALQIGDFCYSQPDSQECVSLWNELKMPKMHVLGNHDMDKCDKAAAMKFTGMPSRYGSYEFGAYRLIVLDLNNFKKEGKLDPYANGNYFTDNATHNWADPEQLAWLSEELRKGSKPTILISHQPLGFAEPGKQLPPEQIEVLKVVTDAAKQNPRGAVAACLCGHMHIDRLESHQGIPCYCVNSASYFWSGGMNPYTRPLYAFMELSSDRLIVEGVAGDFVKPPPKSSDGVIGRSASIANRRLLLVHEGRQDQGLLTQRR
jgi:predicted phosphodiesterase